LEPAARHKLQTELGETRVLILFFQLLHPLAAVVVRHLEIQMDYLVVQEVVPVEIRGREAWVTLQAHHLHREITEEATHQTLMEQLAAVEQVVRVQHPHPFRVLAAQVVLELHLPLLVHL
jgi:hypothetical protein